MIQHFLTTVTLVINARRNRVDVEMKFRKRDGNRTSSFSNPIQKPLTVFSYIFKAEYTFELGR